MKAMSSLISLIISLSISLSMSFNAFAAFDDYDGLEKPLSVGLGTYASVIAFDNAFVDDLEFSGFAITVGYAISNQYLIRGSYFSLEEDDITNLDSSGYDLLAYLGTGLASHGFKAYVGGGLFKEKLDDGFDTESFSGLQLSGGIGYNWDSVSLDLIVGIRDSSDYEDGAISAVDITAVSSSLLLSARF